METFEDMPVMNETQKTCSFDVIFVRFSMNEKKLKLKTIPVVDT